MAVCHVLRYAPESLKLKELIDSGTIGEIVSIQLMEPVDIRRRRSRFLSQSICVSLVVLFYEDEMDALLLRDQLSKCI